MAGIFFFKKFRFFNGKKQHKVKDIEHNFIEFLKKEKFEIDQLRHGEESLKEFCHDSESIFKSYFVPSKCNGHKPRILRTRSLAVITISMLLLKILTVGSLYMYHSDLAEMNTLGPQEILRLVNEERRSQGLKDLSFNHTLNQSALAKAEDMVKKDYFDHTGPDGSKPWDWIDRNQYKYIFVGENLAMNFTSAEAVHKALMDSASHRKNILNERYIEVGMAVISGQIEGQDTNVLVQLFGTRSAPYLAVAENTDSKTAGSTSVLEAKAPEKPEQKPASAPAPAKPRSEQAVPPAPAPKATQDISPEPVRMVTENNQVEQARPEPAAAVSAGEAEIASSFNLPRQNYTEDPNTFISNGKMSRIRVEAAMQDGRSSLADKAANAINVVFLSILAVLALSLIVNIIVHIRVQHKTLIAQTVFTLLILFGLYYVKLHQLEGGISDIIIL